ncbi:MAG: VWA domain-containing protein [Planctomycetota bacterium]
MRFLPFIPALVLFCASAQAEEVSSSRARKYAKTMQALIRAENEEELTKLIARMGVLDHPRSVILIPPAATLLPSKINYEKALEAIGSLENPEAVAALIKHYKKARSLEDKVLLLDSFGYRDDKPTGEEVLASFGNKLLRIQLTGLRAAGRRKLKGAVGPLIALVETQTKERGLLWLEGRRALLKITGQDFETGADWKKWWDAERESFDPDEAPDEDGRTVVVKKAGDSVEFFGTEIFSRNLIFVIDVSGSMAMFDQGKLKRKEAEKARIRLDRARKQLLSAIESLPKTARFNIIVYSNKVTAWQKGLKPASKSAIKSAGRFVKEFLARGATYTDDALKRAFEDSEADTIVLLSDGAPTKPDFPSDYLIGEILKDIANRNAARKMRINTFGFEGTGLWPDKIPGQPSGPRATPTVKDVETFTGFMKQLAEDNHGSFQSIK